MSVLTVNEVAKGRGSGEDQDTRTNVRRFQVFLSDAADDPVEARNALGVPAINDVHPRDPNSFVVSKETEETDNRSVWFVVVNYSTKGTSDRNDPRGAQNPLRENPSIVWTTRDIEVVATEGRRITVRGFFGQGLLINEALPGPITNSAGDLFVNPPLVIPDFLQICTIKRNERPRLDFDPKKVRERLNTINAGGNRIGGISFGLREGWLIRYDGDQIQQREGIDFVPVTYQVMLARRGFTWEDRILDQGLRQKVVQASGEIKLVPIVDINKKRITTPVNLDGKGNKLEEGEDPVFLTYLTKKEINFSSLKLPREYSRTGR